MGETLEVFRKFYLSGKTFIGGDHVSIADIRLAASLEFLHAIDYPIPGWLATYWSAVKQALGTPTRSRRRMWRGILPM